MRCFGLTATRLQLLQNEKNPVLKVAAVPTRRVPPARRHSGGNFVLRIDRTGLPARPAILRSRACWLESILQQTDVVVPEPITSLHGDYVAVMPAPGLGGTAHCSLTRWVVGKPRLLPTGPGAEALGQVGQVMAELHMHGQRFKPGKDAQFPRYDFEGLYGRSSCYYPKDGLDSLGAGARRLFALAMQRMRRVMDRLGCGRDVFGLIHADLVQVNYIFHRGKVRAIDFGDCGYGYYLYDMGVTLLMLHAFDPDGSQRAAFLEGYRQVRPLSVEHEQSAGPFHRRPGRRAGTLGPGQRRAPHAGGHQTGQPTRLIG